MSAVARGEYAPVNPGASDDKSPFVYGLTGDADDLANQGFCACCGECVTRCFLPSIATVGCCCIPYYFRDCKQQVQIYTMRHNDTCTKPIRCCCYVCDLAYDCAIPNTIPFFTNRAKMYGHTNSFAGFNKVVIQDPAEIERLLLTENGRGPYLGITDLAKDRLTTDDTDNHRNVLLLVMDGLEKGKEVSDHQAFRAALLSLTTSPECFGRVALTNATMQKYIEMLKEDIGKCTSSDEVGMKAIPAYLMRTLHWGVLGLDLTDEEYKLLFDTYYKGEFVDALWFLFST
jgi:hypothetical protein